MTLKIKLLSAASALVLSAGAASAAPATAESAVNMRSGPGTQYEVVTTIPGGATVDVAGCTGSWCQVSFNGESGFASRNYLAMAGEAAPSGAVAVVPGDVYDDTPPLYAYDYYDDGYAYGPSFGFVVGPRHRFHHRGHWNGGRIGTWQNRPGWNGARPGGWQGGGNRVGGGWQGGQGGGQVGNVGGAGRGGAMAPGSVAPQMSAPAGMSTGGGAGVFRGGAAAGGGVRAGGAGISAGGAGVFHGGAGAVGRGQGR